MSAAPSFVSNDADALKEALVVRPSLSLERQAPIQGEPAPITERAIESHAVFVDRLRAAGTTVRIIDAPANVSLLSSVGDIALFFRDGAFLMRPADPARRHEVAIVEKALGGLRIPVAGRMEAPGVLDGGDVILAGRTVFVGVPQDRRGLLGVPKTPHGNAAGREQLRAFAASAGLKTVEVSFAADVRRLRAVASLLDAETILYGPRVADGSAFSPLRRIETPDGEEYGAGVLSLGRKRVIANLRFGGISPLLRKAKYAVDAIDLWEFGKVGMTPSFLAAASHRG